MLIHLRRLPRYAKAFTKSAGEPDFWHHHTTLKEMQEAVATYAARAAEKLREQDSLTSCLTIFIKTNSFNKNIPQYSNSFTINFAHPTAFTPEIVKYALEGLKATHKDGYRYKKAGIYLSKSLFSVRYSPTSSEIFP